MQFEIKNRFTGKLIFECETTSWKLAVELAIKSYANLCSANLCYADLRSANLSSADLRYADLSSANLRSANLCSANLCSADLSSADLCSVKNDLWAVLTCAPKEAQGLRQAIIDGKIDGSTYEGDCACLVGTIANIRHCKYDAVPKLRPDSNRPAEQFFLAIRKGDKPENNQCSKIALAWIDEWLENTSLLTPAQER